MCHVHNQWYDISCATLYDIPCTTLYIYGLFSYEILHLYLQNVFINYRHETES